MQWQDEKFEALSRLQANWDGEGSEAPNANAKRLTRLILAALSRGEVTPSAIEPSAESGVGIGFVKGRRRGSIEIFNTGEMIAATYEGREAPVVWEFNSEEESMTSTIGIIRVYMSA